MPTCPTEAAPAAGSLRNAGPTAYSPCKCSASDPQGPCFARISMPCRPLADPARSATLEVPCPSTSQRSLPFAGSSQRYKETPRPAAEARFHDESAPMWKAPPQIPRVVSFQPAGELGPRPQHQRPWVMTLPMPLRRPKLPVQAPGDTPHYLRPFLCHQASLLRRKGTTHAARHPSCFSATRHRPRRRFYTHLNGTSAAGRPATSLLEN